MRVLVLLPLCVLPVCSAFAQATDDSLTFEVASVKAFPPRTFQSLAGLGCDGGPGTSDPVQFKCTNTTMAALVTRAFDLKSYQLATADSGGRVFAYSPQGSVSLPAGIDIIARVPAGATAEQFKTMLQNLLIERFKLTYHWEKKDSEVYELVIAKGGPKLKESPRESSSAAKAAESIRTKPVMGPDGCPVFALPRSVVSPTLNYGSHLCVAGTDAPVSELASFLSRILDRPVTDATALKGRYEFIFGFTVASLPSGRFAGIASMVSDPPDAEPAPALLSVLQDRFGLKLDKKKGPIDFFVIDHVERVPTEN